MEPEVLQARITEARDAFNAGDPVGSGRLYRALLADLDDADTASMLEGRVRALMGIANADFERDGDLDAALDVIDQAEELVAHGQVDSLLTAVHGQRARLHLLSGRTEEALGSFAAGLEHAANAPARDIATLLLNRAVVLMDVGRLAESRADLQRAATVAEAAEVHLIAYKARHNLGWVSFQEGDLPSALSAMRAASNEAARHGVAIDPIAWLDRARVLVEAGLPDDADELLGRAVHALRQAGRHQEEAEALLARARTAVLSEDLPVAHDHARQASETFAARGNQRWAGRAALVQLEAALAMAHEASDPAELRDILRRARELSAADIGEQGALMARLIAVEAELALGDPDGARRTLAAAQLPADASLTTRLHWHRVRALVDLDRAPASAGAQVAAGMRQLGEAQTAVGSLDMRTAMAVHARELVVVGIRAAMRDADRAALHAAVDLAHASSRRLTPVSVDLDEVDLSLLAQLRAVSRSWDTATPTSPGGSHVAQAHRLRARLRERAWQQGSTAGTVADIATHAEHAAALDRRGARSLSYFSLDDRLHALLTASGDLALLELGSIDEVRTLVASLRADLGVLHLAGVPDFIRRTAHASLARTLERLDKALVASAGLDDGALVVVPHDVLSLVPWTLLPSRRRRATTVAASLTGWTSATSMHGPMGHPTVRAMAGPDLRSADDEVLFVSRVWDVAPPESRGTMSGLLDALQGTDVVHVAAHGVHEATSPLFSSVQLADGALFAHEIGRVRAQLVVLAACQVGEQTMRPGDEPLGLGAVLLERGASAVVAACAPLVDELATRLAPRLHELLADGESVAAAVAQVAADAWDQGDVAALVVLGDGLRPVVASSDANG